MRKRTILSVDVDYFPGSEIGLKRILNLFEKEDIKAAFFITGRFAEDYKSAVSNLYNHGHEIGCHGYSHGLDLKENFVDLDIDEQGNRIEKASKAIKDIIDDDVRIFRAPYGKANCNTIKVLEALGYKCDSSVCALRFDFGFGVGNNVRAFFAPTRPYHPSKRNIFNRGDSTVLEVPISAFITPLTLSAVRTFGAKNVCHLFDVSSRFFNPVVFYLHPWEVMKTDEIHLWDGIPKRHNKNRGETALSSLKIFIDHVRRKSDFVLYRDVLEAELDHGRRQEP